MRFIIGFILKTLLISSLVFSGLARADYVLLNAVSLVIGEEPVPALVKNGKSVFTGKMSIKSNGQAIFSCEENCGSNSLRPFVFSAKKIVSDSPENSVFDNVLKAEIAREREQGDVKNADELMRQREKWINGPREYWSVEMGAVGHYQ